MMDLAAHAHSLYKLGEVLDTKREVHDEVHAVPDQLEEELLAQFGFLESVFVERQH